MKGALQMKKTFRVNLLIGAAALIALALTGCSSGRNQTNRVAYLMSTGVAGIYNPWVLDTSTASATNLPTYNVEGPAITQGQAYTGIHLSRDGQTIIYTMYDGSANCVSGFGCSQIYTVPYHNLGSIAPTAITASTTEDHFSAVMSPDETQIASIVRNYAGLGFSELSTIPIATKVETLIDPAGMTGVQTMYSPTFTPDNTHIVFEGGLDADGTDSIWIVANTAVANPTPTRLTNAALTFYDLNPFLNVEGTAFVYSREDGAGNFNVFVLPIAGEIGTTVGGTAAVQLTSDNVSEQPQFTRDYVVVNSAADVADNPNVVRYLYRITPSVGAASNVPLTSDAGTPATVNSEWDVYGF